MPHRNNKDMEELEKSLKIFTEENNNNNIIIAGDFNCPDIQWETLSLKHEASHKEVQTMLIDITSQSGLAQLHEEPNNLIFTTLDLECPGPGLLVPNLLLPIYKIS
jgi:endonuclease/exonuclease/phosphatase family metal-dependent hydrolase